jgi:hypothetical protein
MKANWNNYKEDIIVMLIRCIVIRKRLIRVNDRNKTFSNENLCAVSGLGS